MGEELELAKGTADIHASMTDVAPLMFDLLKVTEFHPFLGTSVIQTEQKSGVGAQRRLTYKTGPSFLETVKESNNVDHVRFELTGHPFPVEKLFAVHNSTKVDDEITTFDTILEFTPNEDTPEGFDPQMLWLAQSMCSNAKKLLEDSASDKAMKLVEKTISDNAKKLEKDKVQEAP